MFTVAPEAHEQAWREAPHSRIREGDAVRSRVGFNLRLAQLVLGLPAPRLQT